MTTGIFLSYASQDADAARRICDGLRATGLEVWFDQNELRGGDAWDASIRKQIKECSLFVPIISANTNAREEGYFRREWNIAVDRMMDMADHKAFLFPVVLGQIDDASAFVPDKFRERQWTRLSDETAIQSFSQRLQQVLSGVSPPQPSERLAPAANHAPNKTEKAAIHVQRRKLYASLIVAGIALAGTPLAWRYLNRNDKSNGDGRKGPMDPRLIKAVQLLDKIDISENDAAIAEDYVKSVLAGSATDVDATIIMGRVQVNFLSRGWDLSEERFANAKRFADRSLTLAPQSPEAMVNVATYLETRKLDFPRATSLVQQAIALTPDEPRYYYELALILSVTPGKPIEEAIAFAKSALERFPNNAELHYQIARLYRLAEMVELMEFHLDRAIVLGSLYYAILLSARSKLYLHRDLAGMKAMLDKLKDSDRARERSVLTIFTYSLMSRQPEIGLKALAARPERWMANFEFIGPTQLLAAELFWLQGKVDFARQRYEAANLELANHTSELASDSRLAAVQNWILFRLGKVEEAKSRNARLFAEMQRPYRLSFFRPLLFNVMILSALLGEKKKALELAQEAFTGTMSSSILRATLELDPRLEQFRKDKQVIELLSSPVPSSTPKATKL